MNLCFSDELGQLFSFIFIGQVLEILASYLLFYQAKLHD